MAELTPMMRQYQELKSRHPGALLFFRLGDFFELFGEDAETASRDLDLVLTSRDGEVPMCGIPHHALEGYLARLMDKGYRVALAEQMEDPKTAKGLVKREVVRLVTPSTWVEGAGGEEGARLAAVASEGGQAALAWAVPATGRFEVRPFSGADALEAALAAAERLHPAEWLAAGGVEGATVAGMAPVEGAGAGLAEAVVARIEDLVGALEAGPSRAAAGAVAAYLAWTHPGALDNLDSPMIADGARRLQIDPHTWRHLEVDRRLDGGRGPGTLLHVLDATVTASGRRTLHRWLEEPFDEARPILERQEGIQAFFDDGLTRSRIEPALRRIRDVERILARLAIGQGTPRDLLLLAESLEASIEVARDLEGSETTLLRHLGAGIQRADDLAACLREALDADPPANWREGRFIRMGYDSRLDALRGTKDDAQNFLAALEEEAKRTTGIRSLKVGYNRVFGYYIEVSKTQLALVPETWERRQTLSGAERFVTSELKEKERVVLEADEEALQLEMALLEALSRKVLDTREALRTVAAAIGEIDALRSLAEVARRHRWVRPEITEEPVLACRSARHPVVEASQGSFVPNDLTLGDTTRLVVLTGPNMAGKSTYLRQTGLIVLLAQMGSFVPAESARIGLVDRLFSRIGASDDLASGRSTFMVEMSEVAEILRGATPRSLVLLDEIGRGTSTFDGISIAWAVAEDIHDRVRARALLATHYLELADLEGLLETAQNWSVSVAEKGEDVVFLRRVVRGPADRSYGLHVARLAGVPEPVLRRARRILASLEKGALTRREAAATGQLAFSFHEPETPGDPEAVRLLREADPESMSPREALAFLFRLKEMLEDA